MPRQHEYAQPVDAKSSREAGIAERTHRRNAEVAAFLSAQLLPGETVLAIQRGGLMVTDRRVLFPWPGYPSGWRSDAIAFEEVTRWSLGHRHDGRPLLRLEHPTRLRTERVAAHHFLWFAWGNAEAQIPHNDITLAFGTEREEAFRATFNRLLHMNGPRGEDFVVMLKGTREERSQGSALYRVFTDEDVAS
jgi:hypothetical protein